MAYPVYYVLENDTLPHLFDSFDGGTGASITLTGLAVTDIEIYKDGGITQRASDSGYALLDTDGIDFDGVTGIHGFSIDLSDNTTAGFYEVGPWYHVVVASVTIDGQTVSFVACAFRIVSTTRGMAGTALPAAAADAAGGLPISDAGGLDLDAQIGADIDAILVDTGTTLQAELDGIQADTEDIQARLPAALVGGRIDATVDGTGLEAAAAAVIADAVWDEAATGHTDAGKAGEQLWTDVDAILVDTGTTLQGEVDGIQADTEDIQARLPAALVGGRIDANAGAISADATAADRLEALMDGSPVVQVNGVATATSIPIDGFTSTRNDQFNGRLLTVLDGSFEQTDILDYDHATQTLTVTALSAALADDAFIVIH